MDLNSQIAIADKFVPPKGEGVNVNHSGQATLGMDWAQRQAERPAEPPAPPAPKVSWPIPN